MDFITLVLAIGFLLVIGIRSFLTIKKERATDRRAEKLEAISKERKNINIEEHSVVSNIAELAYTLKTRCRKIIIIEKKLTFKIKILKVIDKYANPHHTYKVVFFIASAILLAYMDRYIHIDGYNEIVYFYGKFVSIYISLTVIFLAFPGKHQVLFSELGKYSLREHDRLIISGDTAYQEASVLRKVSSRY